MNPIFQKAYDERMKINTMHAERGVVIINPENTYIDAEAKIGKGTIIYPNNHIEGGAQIGENCVIGPDNRIIDCIIGNDVNIQYTVAVQSKIGGGTAVGPFAYIRPGSNIGENSKIGDFVEIKNSNIGNGTKIPHLTYVGDSDVGNNINIGCGSITVNYDGKNKFRTVIEDDVFVGCNSSLIAPVSVGKGAYIAAGSTITEDVPEKTMAIARSRQMIKAGWVRPYERE